MSTAASTFLERNASKIDIARQVLVAVATVSVIVANGLANWLPLNGVSTGELSDLYPVLITPAGYVFSIWSLIYVGLAAYTVYQALPAQRTNPVLRATGWAYIISSIFNIGWLFAWHYEYVTISLVVMVALLAALIYIYHRLYPYFSSASTVEMWSVHFPFRIYLGWITVATVVNAAVVLYSAGWRGGPLSEPIWAVIMVLVATSIGFVFALWRRDAAYVFVLIWAFVGIYFANQGIDMLENITIITSILLGMSLAYAYVMASPRELPEPASIKVNINIYGSAS